jgi:hypothetical protein
MSSTTARIPPLRQVQATLARVTESLAAELAFPSLVPPAWGELEWRLAQAAAAIHGISPLLCATLRWRGPPDWSEYLAEQRRHTLLRQQRIAELLTRVDERARSAGIAVIALKGAALHTAGIYAAGERPMADLDLLVHSRDLTEAVAVLLALSYRDAGTTWKHQAFDPPSADRRAALGEHTENPIKIDLHSRIGERLPLAFVNLTDLIYPTRPEPGLNPYPSAAALMLHLLAHTAGNMTNRGLRLVQLCDIARLARRMTVADWDELIGFDGREQRLWWAAAPLTLAARYFPASIPHEPIRRLARGCPWLLRQVSQRRTLAEFSFSHLYTDPIPGIVWTQSPAQMLRYLIARAWPDKELLAQRQVLARTEPWASDAWCRQSQSRRIIRWLTSRPARIETLHPVRAALARAR